MEKELIKYLLDYGILGIIGFVFMKYIIKILNEQQVNSQKFYNEFMETLILLKEKILHSYLNDEIIIILLRLTWRLSISNYRRKMIMYLHNNNIKENINTIKDELDTFIDTSVARLSELLKNRTNEDNRKKAIDILKNKLVSCNDLILKELNEIIKKDIKDYKKLIRKIETLLRKKENNTIDDIENMEL